MPFFPAKINRCIWSFGLDRFVVWENEGLICLAKLIVAGEKNNVLESPFFVIGTIIFAFEISRSSQVLSSNSLLLAPESMVWFIRQIARLVFYMNFFKLDTIILAGHLQVWCGASIVWSPGNRWQDCAVRSGYPITLEMLAAKQSDMWTPDGFGVGKGNLGAEHFPLQSILRSARYVQYWYKVLCVQFQDVCEPPGALPRRF